MTLVKKLDFVEQLLSRAEKFIESEDWPRAVYCLNNAALMLLDMNTEMYRMFISAVRVPSDN